MKWPFKRSRRRKKYNELLSLVHRLNDSRCDRCHGFGYLHKENGTPYVHYLYMLPTHNPDRFRPEEGLRMAVCDTAYGKGYSASDYEKCPKCRGRGFAIRPPEGIRVVADRAILKPGD